MTTPAHITGQLTGRQLVLLGTAVLHVLVFQVLSLTIGVPPFKEREERIQAFFPEDSRPQQPVDRPQRTTTTRPDLDPQHPQLPLSDPNLDDTLFDQAPLDPVGSTGPNAGGDIGIIAGTVTPATSLFYTALRSTDDFYPPASIRLGEEGVTQLRVCVSAAGTLQGRPVVTAISGRARLDAAAQAWASQALRFAPATQNGVPVDACKGFKVSFRLHD
jgi:TonB family protein